MNYAVVLQGEQAVDSEQLQAAYQSTFSLAPQDAIAASRRPCGVLAVRLNCTEAQSLCGALKRLGVEACVVDEREFFSLPPHHTIIRASLDEKELLVYDIAGKPTQVLWEGVAVIAAGQVEVLESDTVPLSEDPAGRRLATGELYLPIQPRHISTPRSRLLLDIVLADRSRYRIFDRKFRYDYLAERMQPQSEGNFIQVVADFQQWAKDAMLNQGALGMLDGAGRQVRYDHRRDFDWEISWLLWRWRQRLLGRRKT